MMPRRLLPLLLLALLLPVATASAAEQREHTVAPYMRVIDSDDAMRLDMAVRFFVPAEGDGPTVAMAGVIHIADRSFYDLVQHFLDSQDLVLFEGVKPRGVAGAGAALDDEARIRRTRSAIRFTAIMLERHKSTHGAYPESLAELADTLAATNRRQADLLRSSATDAWERPLLYTLTDDGFDLRSRGADGRPGGDGPDAEIAFADQRPLTPAESGGDPGLQARLASALGLTFQGEALSHDRPHHHNSDLTIDEVEERVSARGGDASGLFSILDGSSMMGRMAGMALRLIEGNPRMQVMTKVMLLETMRTVAEEGFGAAMRGAGANMGAIMEVILVDRNQVVIEDLRAVLAGDDPPASIAVVYGAGHMDDLEQRLVRDVGYRPAGTFWLPAMRVDLAEAGVDRREIDMMRQMMQRMTPREN